MTDTLACGLCGWFSLPCPAADREEAWADNYAGEEGGEVVRHVEGDQPVRDQIILYLFSDTKI